MKVYDCPQVSVPWWQLRRGIPTASEADKIMTAAKRQYSTQSRKLIAQLCGDIANLSPNYFTDRGRPINSYAIENGKNTEAEARRWVAMELGRDVAEVGFITSDDGKIGASPDGLLLGANRGERIMFNRTWDLQQPVYQIIGAEWEAGLELKCPLLATQTEYLLDQQDCSGQLADGSPWMPAEYLQQVHMSLIVSGLERWHFVSYAPGLPAIHAVIGRTDFTGALQGCLDRFLTEFAAAKAALGLTPKESS
jgi:hypothetical protein